MMKRDQKTTLPSSSKSGSSYSISSIKGTRLGQIDPPLLASDPPNKHDSTPTDLSESEGQAFKLIQRYSKLQRYRDYMLRRKALSKKTFFVICVCSKLKMRKNSEIIS